MLHRWKASIGGTHVRQVSEIICNLLIQFFVLLFIQFTVFVIMYRFVSGFPHNIMCHVLYHEAQSDHPHFWALPAFGTTGEVYFLRFFLSFQPHPVKCCSSSYDIFNNLYLHSRRRGWRGEKGAHALTMRIIPMRILHSYLFSRRQYWILGVI